MKTSKTQRALTSLKTAQSVAANKFLGTGTMVSTTKSLAQLAEGLSEFHANPDPDATKEQQARRYLKRYEGAMKTAQSTIARERDALDRAMVGVYERARGKAGMERPMNSIEIRQALLRLDVKARDEALKTAASEGRGEVFAALEGQPEWLYGGSSLPMKAHVERLLETASPGYLAEMEKIDEARRTLDLAENGFRDHAESLRDVLAERDAEAAQQRHQRAEEMLSSVA